MNKFKNNLEEKAKKAVQTEKKMKLYRFETLEKGISLIQKIFELILIKIAEEKEKTIEVNV